MRGVQLWRSGTVQLLADRVQEFINVAAALLNLTVLWPDCAVSRMDWLWRSCGGIRGVLARLPQADKANTAVRLAIEYIENTYTRPSWWNGQPQQLRDGVVASLFMMSAPDVCQRGCDGLCLDGKIFATASVRREVR
jgi:hypothetical protein